MTDIEKAFEQTLRPALQAAIDEHPTLLKWHRDEDDELSIATASMHYLLVFAVRDGTETIEERWVDMMRPPSDPYEYRHVRTVDEVMALDPDPEDEDEMGFVERWVDHVLV